MTSTNIVRPQPASVWGPRWEALGDYWLVSA